AKPAHGTCRWVLPLAADFGVLQINGTSYALCRLAGGFRLMKPDGQTYDLDASDADYWICTCPDYEFARHQKDPAGCKHVKAVKAALAHLGKPIRMPADRPAAEAGPDARLAS